jgi:hypothetical protein
MRNLATNELKAVSGGAAPKRKPRQGAGRELSGSADKNSVPRPICLTLLRGGGRLRPPLFVWFVGPPDARLYSFG